MKQLVVWQILWEVQDQLMQLVEVEHLLVVAVRHLHLVVEEGHLLVQLVVEEGHLLVQLVVVG